VQRDPLQAPLPFDAPVASPEPGNERELVRVGDRLDHHVLAFARERVGRTFHLDELRAFVVERAGAVAPESAGRILRSLRARRALSYSLVNRARSEYRVTWAARELPPTTTAPALASRTARERAALLRKLEAIRRAHHRLCDRQVAILAALDRLEDREELEGAPARSEVA
jgi:hypothetical protein